MFPRKALPCTKTPPEREFSSASSMWMPSRLPRICNFAAPRLRPLRVPAGGTCRARCPFCGAPLPAPRQICPPPRHCRAGAQSPCGWAAARRRVPSEPAGRRESREAPELFYALSDGSTEGEVLRGLPRDRFRSTLAARSAWKLQGFEEIN